MRQTRSVELGTGLFVILGLAALGFLFTSSTGEGIAFLKKPTYTVSARFDEIGSLKVRSPVQLAGVRIGQVESISLDTKRFVALVSMTIDSEYNNLPSDSSASILTAGLLGGNYVGISPGFEEEYLKNGSQIFDTQPAIVLEKLISKFLFSSASKGDNSGQ